MPDELPGGELPKAVYRSIVGAFACMLFVAWVAFGHDMEMDLALAMAVLLTAVFVAVPWLLFTAATHHTSAKQEDVKHFLSSRIDTATGPISGREAWLQIVIIPAALALAALLLGAVYIFMG